jgi:hypothetical protein
MVLTAEETADEFPVGTPVVFRGYEEDAEVKGWLRVGQTLTVVRHNTLTGSDGIVVTSARGDEYVVFATEVVHACHLCDGPEPDGHRYCEPCSVFQCEWCDEVDVTTAEVEGGGCGCATTASSGKARRGSCTERPAVSRFALGCRSRSCGMALRSPSMP